MAKCELVPFRVTVCGIEELAGHVAGDVTHVLSILDPGWPEPEALRAFEVHRRLELRFHDMIEPHPELDRAATRDIELLLAFGRDLAATPMRIFSCIATLACRARPQLRR